jgi:hypothetical protein
LDQTENNYFDVPVRTESVQKHSRLVSFSDDLVDTPSRNNEIDLGNDGIEGNLFRSQHTPQSRAFTTNSTPQYYHQSPLSNHSLLTNTRNVTNHQIEPPCFSGKEPWLNFIYKFEQIATFNGWNDQTKKLRLSIAVEGDALEFCVALPLLDAMTYDCLKGHLRQRFGTPNHEEMYKSQFKTRVRLDGEDVQAFMSDLQRLAGKAYPREQGQLFYEMICAQFIDGLRHRDCKEYLQFEIRRARCNGMLLIQEMLELAYRYISIKGPLDRVRKPVNYDRNYYYYENRQGSQTDDRPINRRNPGFAYQRPERQNFDHAHRYERQIICTYCGGEGHIASRCFHNRERQGN